MGASRMARRSWFSEEGDDFVFHRYVERVDTWKTAIADGRVTGEEVRAQAERVAELMQTLEDRLDDDLHEYVTTVFLEWAVLQGLQSLAIVQEERGGAQVDPSGGQAWDSVDAAASNLS
jgi:hypothetical protein